MTEGDVFTIVPARFAESQRHLIMMLVVLMFKFVVNPRQDPNEPSRKLCPCGIDGLGGRQGHAALAVIFAAFYVPGLDSGNVAVLTVLHRKRAENLMLALGQYARLMKDYMAKI